MEKTTYLSVYRHCGVTVRTYILHGKHFAQYRLRKDADLQRVSSASWLGVRMLAERSIHEQLRRGFILR